MDRSSAPAQQNPDRLDYLDALRGIAAVLVVLHHCYQTSPFWPTIVRFGPARVLLNGRSSVIFFFVLSGFVLAYGLFRSRQSAAFGTFIKRRFVRIYLPYATAGLIAFAAMLSLQPAAIADAAVTFNEMWSAPLTLQSILEHLSLAGTSEAKAINLPSWSLVYELRISLLMPLLCFCAVRSARWLGATTLVLYGLCAILAPRMGIGPVPYAASGPLANIVVTVHFTAAFVIGTLLAQAALGRARWLFDMPSRRKILVGLAATILLLVFRDETAAIGSACVIILALNTPAMQRALRRPVLLWLGRVSFSLYLTHMIVLQLVVRSLLGVVPLRVSILIALVAMLPAALLFFESVEAPTAHWAKRMGRVRPDASAWGLSGGRRASEPSS